MPFLLAEILNFQGSTHLIGMGSFSKELKRQVTDRVNNLPQGSTQEIVLDVRGRNFSGGVIDNVVNHIKSYCELVYKDIPVAIMNY